MSAVSLHRPRRITRRGCKLNPNPQQKYWFDPPAPRTSVEAERRHRQERLAGAFRLFARFGFAQGLAGHITARDPELTDHFWVNPLGVHFSRIKVSDLLLVNSKGETVIGDRPLNKAAFAIHAAIHEYNPKIDRRRAHALDLRQGLVDAGPQARHADAGQLRVPRRRGAVRRLHRHGGRRERRPAHREGAGRPQGRDPQEPRHPDRRPDASRPRPGGTSRSTTPATRNCWPKPPAQPQPIDEAVARHTHGQIGGPEGARHAFESLYEGLVEAEPELLQ